MEQQAVFDYIKKKYKVLPEYPWRRYPEYAVFRHADNNKWFVLSATVPRNKLGIPGADHVDVINVKVDDPFFRDMMIQENGIMPAYHMNKQHWITVLLNGTVQDEKVCNLIDMSFLATASVRRKNGSSLQIQSTLILFMLLMIQIRSTGSREPESGRVTLFLCMLQLRFRL